MANIKGFFLKAFRHAKYQTVSRACSETVNLLLKINACLKLCLNAYTRKWLLLETLKHRLNRRNKLLLFERVKEHSIIPCISLEKKKSVKLVKHPIY